jgi:hypothetical protein
MSNLSKKLLIGYTPLPVIIPSAIRSAEKTSFLVFIKISFLLQELRVDLVKYIIYANDRERSLVEVK